MLSIVIPTLNAETDLPGTLAIVQAATLPHEIVITDGGSQDQTPVIAADAGAKFTATLGGRGPQLAAGTMYATGDWLLFLHADTRPQPGWDHVVRNFMANPENRFRAGYFQFILNDPAPAARRLEGLVHWRCQTFGLPYGDQGLLISREFYDLLGGFKPVALMEDVEMARAIGKKRLSELPSAALTSAEKYQQGGYWMRPIRNLWCLGLYFIGVPSRMIGWFYQ